MAKHRAPFISLWSRDDVRTAIADFLPTRAVAVLPVVAKPLRTAQTPLLVTAIRRRGKTTVPSPQTTRALLDALLVGEPQHFCEKWERGLEQWEEETPQDYTVSFSQWSAQSSRYLRLTRDNVSQDDHPWGTHSGISRRIHGDNLLVTRFRLTMSYEECADGGAVGYAMLRGPPGSDMVGPRFDSEVIDEGGYVSYRLKLVWMDTPNDVGSLLIEDPSPQTSYTIDARFRHESVTCALGKADVSVNGRLVIEGRPCTCEPLERLHLYNFSRGRVHVGPIEIWYEKTASTQFRNPFWHDGA